MFIARRTFTSAAQLKFGSLLIMAATHALKKAAIRRTNTIHLMPAGGLKLPVRLFSHHAGNPYEGDEKYAFKECALPLAIALIAPETCANICLLGALVTGYCSVTLQYKEPATCSLIIAAGVLGVYSVARNAALTAVLSSI